MSFKGNRISPMQMMIMLTVRNESMYGYNIIKSLRDRFDGVWEPKTGAVYPAIKRLQEHGLLTSEMQDDKEHYSLSDEGREWLKESVKMLGGGATMGIRFMSVILEAHDEMGFKFVHPSCMHDTPMTERLAKLKRMRENMELDLKMIDEMIERLERNEEWEE